MDVPPPRWPASELEGGVLFFFDVQKVAPLCLIFLFGNNTAVTGTFEVDQFLASRGLFVFWARLIAEIDGAAPGEEAEKQQSDRRDRFHKGERAVRREDAAITRML